MKKMTKKQQEICDTWDAIEFSRPDLSYAGRMNMTGDYCKVEVSDIVEALSIRYNKYKK